MSLLTSGVNFCLEAKRHMINGTDCVKPGQGLVGVKILYRAGYRSEVYAGTVAVNVNVLKFIQSW